MSYGQKRTFGESKTLPIVILIVLLIIIGYFLYPMVRNNVSSSSTPQAQSND